MMTSAKPSPLTSPAEATAEAARSHVAPRRRCGNRCMPSRLDRSIFAGEARRPCRTPRSSRRVGDAVGIGELAPTITIVKAVAVEVARRGHRKAGVARRRFPVSLKPLVPLRRTGRYWRQTPRPCRTPHSSRRHRSPYGSSGRRRRSRRRNRRR